MFIPTLFLVGFTGLFVWAVAFRRRVLDEMPNGPHKTQLLRTLGRGE